MALSNVTYTYSGGAKLFSIPFDYIKNSDIVVFVNNVVINTFTIDNKIVTITSALSGGDRVSLYRNTEKNAPAVQFKNAGGLDSAQLDLNSEQLFYIMQEALDNLDTTMGQAPDGTWDADGRAITNYPAPVYDTDLVRKQDVPSIAVEGAFEAIAATDAHINTVSASVLTKASIDSLNTHKSSTDHDSRYYTKSAVDNLQATALIPMVSNSVNSAKVNASGYADYIAKVSDTSIVHYAGGSNPNIVETDVLGRTHTITADETITGITNNGTYEMLKEYDLATGEEGDLVAINTGFILTPIMTTNTAPSGTASASSELNASSMAWEAFDGSSASIWISLSAPSVGTPQWLKYDFGSGISERVSKIVIVNSSDTNTLKSATFQGSNDDSTWTTLLTISNDTNQTAFSRREFSFGNANSYRYYRLNITDRNNTLNYVAIGNLELYRTNTVKEVQVLDTATFYDGDYRTVTGVQPNRQYKKAGGTTTETTFVRRGQATKTSGTMGTPVSYALGGYAESAKGMPSNRYIDLTLGASGSTYTAPSNGWVTIRKASTAVNQFIALLNITNSFSVELTYYAAVGGSIYMPVKKGDIIQYNYTVAGVTTYNRFYYAEGVN